MTPDKYQEEFIIPGYFIDNQERLRPSSFFDIAQELAIRGATMLGAPDTILHERSLGWVLIRNAIHFDAFPRIEEKVTLQTWHSGVSGPFFTRDYLCIDGTGKAIVRATSCWALMNIEKRSVVKPDSIFDIFPSEPQCPERALEPNAPKIFIPRDAVREAAGEHVVRYTDLDYNNHANNGKYPHWAMDCLPEEVTLKKSVRDFYLNYNREARMGDTVALVRAQDADGAWYVEGLCDDLQSFICKIVFE